MNFFSYVIEHDYGLAPNPFGGYCTLAVCKPHIRKNRNLQIGDWVIGTGSKKLDKLNHLIYTMQVEEIISFDDYWSDVRFNYKKPKINGSLAQMYGDNFYYTDAKTNDWIQEPSAHSIVSRTKHIKRDTSANKVLISSSFYYLGDNAMAIPEDYIEICKKGPGMKYKDLNEIGPKFIQWVQTNIEKGITGDPNNWSEYLPQQNQTRLIL